MSQRQFLETGTVGNDVFVAGTARYYDKAKKPLGGELVHILSFDLDEAEYVIKNLRKEVQRQKRKLAAKQKENNPK